MPCIKSLLDTDLYKLSMQQAVLHQFPEVQAEFEFKCRNEGKGLDLALSCMDEIMGEIETLDGMGFEDREIEYLAKSPYLKKSYIEFLQNFRLNTDYIDLYADDKGLQIRIAGTWSQVILFEIYLLAIVNEIFFRNFVRKEGLNWEVGKNRLRKKADFLKGTDPGFKFAEFGTRRRFSYDWQDVVVGELAKTGHLAGTSNVFLAMKYGLTPIGTMAHEMIEAGQALTRVCDSQKFMLEAWVKEYRGQLGTALSDTLGVDAFLRDFDLYFAKLYDGVRQDSGNPYEFGEKIISHYEKLNIDPKTKLIVFSDSLTIPKAYEIYLYFKDRIKVSFGIGTNLTNDVGFDPLNIVIKMTKCNGQPVAKISDSPGKCMCHDEEYIKYLKSVFMIKN